jgi:hypothetical protein
LPCLLVLVRRVLFRRVVGWTALLAAILALLVFLQSTPVLSGLVP